MLNPPNQRDQFEQLLRRQGYHATALASIDSDPNVIRWANGATGDEESARAHFFERLGRKTERTLLRAILNAPRTNKELASICKDEQRLSEALEYFQSGGIVIRENDMWFPGHQCAHINNIGHTLEWFVAEWFRRQLGIPAMHGVSLREVPRGGDLDVVAIDNSARIMVECKSQSPKRIPDEVIIWFLQRSYDFDPEVAVFLIDSTDSVESTVKRLMDIYGDMAAKQRGEPFKPIAAIEPSGYSGLYWCTRNVFVIGIPHNLDRSMTKVLRWYHSYVRHQGFSRPTGRWDFVTGTVEHTDNDEPAVAVDGQQWTPY